MSKIAIILCAVFFVSAANASFISDELHSAQQEIDGIVALAISRVRERFQNVREGAVEKLKKVEDAARNINKKLTDYVASLIQRTKDEIKRILHRGKDADVSTCSELLKDVDSVSVEIYSKMTGCVVAKINAGVSYVDKMKKTSDEVIENLEALRAEAKECGSNVNNTRSALRAVFCVKLVAAKATWAAAKAVPSVTFNLGKLSLLLGTLQPSLAFCTKKEAFSVLMAQSANIVQKTGTCVQEKIVSKIGKKPTTVVPGIPDVKPTGNSTNVSTVRPSSSSASDDSSKATSAPSAYSDGASSEVSTTASDESSSDVSTTTSAESSSETPASDETPASSEASPSPAA